MRLRSLPPFRDLSAFLAHLERAGQLVRVAEPVSLIHEVTEIHRRVIAAGGPALLFQRPVGTDGHRSNVPVLVNLFGTAERAALGLGVAPDELEALGEALTALREPEPIVGVRDALSRLPLARAGLSTRPAIVRAPPAQDLVWRGEEIDLARLPIQTCWPGEPAPLLTWPLVMTASPGDPIPARMNVGVYRMQVVGRDRLIVRWLAHRGGARHHRLWAERGEAMPVAVAIGADRATMLAAVLPLPEQLSELAFSGLLRGERPRLSQALTVPLIVPADAEIVLEGWVSPEETAPEGPFGDHTGYFNAVEPFPVVQLSAITMRRRPIYLSTFTGRAPDEPAVIGAALNALFLPMLRRAFPEVIDCWLPPEACSYRIAIVSMRKRYPGHARRLMLGLWSMLPQLTYCKMIIAVDDDIAARRWPDVMWAVATRSDPSRDLIVLENTPIDTLDFASPKPGLGGKLGTNATTKIGPETERQWGRVLTMTPEVI